MNNHKDAGRGIARIDYDSRNNPVRIQFTDGSVTKYVYSAAGEKLRTTHLTAVPNISVAIGSTRELAPSEILSTDSTDYLLGGSLTLRNGRIDRLQFDEGYCQATEYSGNPMQDDFFFYYYDRDHLGNIRQVVRADRAVNGTVLQTMDYYPFGAQLCDGSTDSNLQPLRYNGKEFDRMHGLNTYDYGARQYNPVTARWDRMDPLCEKYYDVSPYTYCHNNPINRFDPDGEDDYWLTNMGYIVWGAQTNHPYHTIYANNGSSINVSKSFIDSQRNYVASGMSSIAKGNKISTYYITTYTVENGEGKGIFEFFTNNTKVEWSNVTLSSPKGSVEIIGTSNSEGDDLSMSIIIEEASADQTVTQATHSHDFDNSLPSPADIKVAHQINSRYPNASLYIFDRLGYNKYDEFSSTELNIIVTPDKVFYDDER